nr:ribonuclease H-like domain-containing protein [Tanacetum cinerariifolium]
MMVQAQEELGKDIAIPTETHPTPIITQPSLSQPSRKQKPKKTKRQDTKLPQTSVPIETVADEAVNEEMKQKPKKTKRQDTELPQTSVPIETVADEAVNEEMYDSLERATNTPTSLDTEQDRGNIIVVEKEVDGKDVSVVEGINAASIGTSVTTTTPTISMDEITSERLQTEEQKQLIDAEKAKLFMEFIKKRRKFFATKRAKEKRNKPPAKVQQRSLMCTYLKNMDGWKTRALKNKSFAEIQDLFNKAMKRKIEDENESADLKRCLEIVLDDGDDVTIDEFYQDLLTPFEEPKRVLHSTRKLFKTLRQFCDSDLEVAFRQHTCFIRNLEGVDLLTGSRGNNLYTLSLQDMMASSSICLLSKASKTKSWLWHRRLSHLNFGAINHLARQGLVRGLSKLKFEKDHLCSACAMGKSTKKSHKPKSEDTSQEKLYLLHMDLCGPMRVESINGKKYILVIVDDYSRFTWVKFLRSKDETPMFIIKFLKMIQVRLNVLVRRIRTDNRTEFVNQTLRDYYEGVGISHETSVARSPQQNGVVERRNRTLIEAAHTMLIYAQAPLFLWAEAVATACFT